MPEAARNGFEEAMDYPPREVAVGPGRWECAQDLGLAQAGKGVLPQQAKALLLSYPLLSMPCRTWKFSEFLSMGKTWGKSIPCCGKWAPRSGGSAAPVSRAGRQRPAVTLPRGMIPDPLDALLSCLLTW